MEVGEKDGVFEFLPFVPVPVAFVFALPMLPLQAYFERQRRSDMVLLQQGPLISPHLLLCLHISNYYLKTKKSSPALVIKLQAVPGGQGFEESPAGRGTLWSCKRAGLSVKLKIIKVEAGLRYYRGGLLKKAGEMGWERSA